jgi:predicted RNA-binding Zn ribbon-like protein
VHEQEVVAMADRVKDAWDEVGEGLARLGQAMKERYTGAEAPAGTSTGESAAGLRDAIERLVAAGRDVGQRAADVARDDGVNAQIKHAATALNEALSATVDTIGREVASWFSHPGPTAQPADDPEAVTTSTPQHPPAT